MIRSAVPESPEWWEDPLGFIRFFWPHIRLYDKQVQILESIRDDDTTLVPAANMMGKDFIAGLANVWFFCSRTPARGLTTSVDQDQLEGVLWGEMRRFIKESRYPLPILYNHLLIRKIVNARTGELCPLSEIVGRVARAGEGYLGRHLPRDIPRSLVTHDEASSIDDTNLNATDTWAHRTLIIGNCYPTTNRFYKSVKRGNLPHATKPGCCYDRIITIRATDSPNVQCGIEAAKRGLPDPGPILEGVMPYDEYMKRRNTWDAMRQSIGLDAEFYEGHEVKLFPVAWRNISALYATSLTHARRGRAMGVDGAEGGDNTCWVVVDDDGLIYIKSQKTPDTACIPEITVNLMTRFGLEPEDVWFDMGGSAGAPGFLRRQYGNKPGQFPVVSFAETASDVNRFKRMRTSRQKKEASEQSQRYKNRRAEMYGLVRELLDPAIADRQFGIPNTSSDPETARVLNELQRQMSLFPYNLDGEGRVWLPPKRKTQGKESNELTLTDIIGNSPDESDALVIAVYGLYHKASKFIVGQTKGIVGAA